MEVAFMFDQCFFVLFDSIRSVFYQDSQWGATTDVLMAEHYASREEAEQHLKYRKNKAWAVKKVTVTVEM